MQYGQTKQHFSIPSLIALGAAIGSFFVGALAGFILALIAIAFAIIGFLLALLPGTRGGFVSLFSLVLGSIGLVIAIIRAVVWAV